MKFAHKIIAAFALILLLSLGLLSVNQYISMEGKMEELIGNSVDEILQGISNTVESEMQGKTNLAMYTTALVEQNFPLDDARSIISQPVLNQNFLLIGFGHLDSGRYVASDPSWDPGSDWDPRKRPWFIDAQQAGKLIITAPYADAVSKEIVVSVGTPVKQSGVFSGAIFFDVSLAGLSEMINKVNLLNAGFAFMATKDGTIISHPQSSLNGKSMNQFLPGVRISDRVQTTELKGKDTLISFKKVAGLDWYVGVALDKDKAYEAVDGLRTDAVIYSIVFLVIGVAVLLFLLKILLRPLSEINLAMADIASGHADLTVRLNTDSDLEFAELARSFNQFTEMLQNLVRDVQDKSNVILGEINNTATDASHTCNAIKTQLDELSALATCTNELSATSLEMANTAKQASDAVTQADTAAIEGERIVEGTTSSITRLSGQIDSTVSVVSELENASSGIENILGVITGIAEQTNLLALNAAIEAARAGESGRGFAVVADEVRTLAQRTQEATTEIKGMIEQLQTGTVSAVEEMKQSKEIADSTVSQASETNEALSAIRDAIKTILDLNVQITQSAQEQVVVVEEVNRNAVNVKDISEQVAEDTTRANQVMQNQVENIHYQEEKLKQFTV